MVKNILKKNGITLLQFANDLNISRPTLDVYIKNYDNQVELSNSVFQKIFDFLFEDNTLSIEEFKNKYEYVKSYYGKKDTDLSSLHSKSISSSEIDEYDELCDKIIGFIEKSKEMNKIPLDKLKGIEKVLFEDNPKYEIVWDGNKNTIIKIIDLNIYRLCVKMLKSEPDGFIMSDYKYGKLLDDTSFDYLKGIAETLEK